MDFDNIKAVMENSLLVINIPKINLDSKTIKINKIES
jgi:HSP20 family molecular chaperone IbpA